MSESILVELISAIDYDLDKKGFTWSLARYDSKFVTLKLNFENFEYISIEKVDKIRIKFMNTQFYLKAKD